MRDRLLLRVPRLALVAAAGLALGCPDKGGGTASSSGSSSTTLSTATSECGPKPDEPCGISCMCVDGVWECSGQDCSGLTTTGPDLTTGASASAGTTVVVSSTTTSSSSGSTTAMDCPEPMPDEPCGVTCSCIGGQWMCEGPGCPDPCASTCGPVFDCELAGTGSTGTTGGGTGGTGTTGVVDDDCGPGFHCEDVGQCSCEELVCVPD